MSWPQCIFLAASWSVQPSKVFQATGIWLFSNCASASAKSSLITASFLNSSNLKGNIGKHWLAAVEILLESPSSLVLRVPKFPIKQQKGASNLCLGYAFFCKYSREILTPADSSSQQLHGSNDWLRCSQETAGDYLLVWKWPPFQALGHGQSCNALKDWAYKVNLTPLTDLPVIIMAPALVGQLRH